MEESHITFEAIFFFLFPHLGNLKLLLTDSVFLLLNLFVGKNCSIWRDSGYYIILWEGNYRFGNFSSHLGNLCVDLWTINITYSCILLDFFFQLIAIYKRGQSNFQKGNVKNLKRKYHKTIEQKLAALCNGSI